MKSVWFTFAFLAVALLPPTCMGAQLTQVFSDQNFQLTGISVSKTGRVFINYPRWSAEYLNAVVEVMPDGSVKPFPDTEWNRWDLKATSAETHFVCVQSVVVDDSDNLWVLDPAAPMLITTVPGGPKLVKIDLKTNKVTRVIPFGPDVAKTNSYLNDIRFDLKRNTAYMTDSGPGGLVVLDLNTGKAHRALDGNPAVKVEPGMQVTANGKTLLNENGKPPQFNSDGIALSPDGEYLYFQAITAKTLYRIKTDVLRDASAQPGAVAAALEKFATTFPCDGLWMDSKSNIYLGKISENAVVQLHPDKTMTTLVKDPRLQWPDTFSQGPDGSIYITASHINDSPTLNNGKSVRTQPYVVFKFSVGKQ